MYSNKTTGAAVPRLFCSYIYYILGFQPEGSSASGVFGLFWGVRSTPGIRRDGV